MSQQWPPYSQFTSSIWKDVSIAPLITFRMAFGLVMLLSCVRYMWMGWVTTQLSRPLTHFSYYGFEWVKPLPEAWMYALFALMCVASLAIALGWYYRVFTVIFFLAFTYVELIDITYYLNHYYFVSIVSFLLIFVPANRSFSLDVARKPELLTAKVPAWTIGIFMLQIAIVYIYAGLAKINEDWLIHALPLAIWLPAQSSLPVIGFLFEYDWTPYLFSWAGMLFDTLIIFFLIWKKTRVMAYLAVVIFHTITGILFQIGVFPVLMIMGVTIFFSEKWHEHLIRKIAGLLNISDTFAAARAKCYAKLSVTFKKSVVTPVIILFFIFQLIFPWRYILYPGDLFWTEEGYRFSWRVMLMEKAGTAVFYVRDRATGKEGAVINSEFLNAHQEKQMAMQPDLILQFAHFLKSYYEKQGVNDPAVRAEVWVTLNARPAQLLIDPQIDLTQYEDGWAHKDWILPSPKSEQL
jgi:hypothetical protein